MIRILLINPNSNDLVTQKLIHSLRVNNIKGRSEIKCITLDRGPFGIETTSDIKLVIPMIMQTIEKNLSSFDAFVIACYSDPGLLECKKVFSKPIFGIHESAVKLSTRYKLNFGVIALSEDSIERHRLYINTLGLELHYVGEEALNISVNEAVSNKNTLNKIILSGKKLIKNNHAEIIILGCAGMSAHRAATEQQLRIKVVDPVQASIVMATEAL